MRKSTSLNDRIELDALTPAYRMAHKTTFVSLLAPAIVIMVMWPKIDHATLLGWGMLVVIGLAIQYMLASSFLRKQIKYSDVYKWGWRLSAVYFYFGLLWAIAVFLFYVQGEAEYQLFLLTLVVTFSMGTIVMGQHWFAMYYMYGPITLAAVIVRLVMEGSYPYIALAVFLLLTGLGSISSSRVLHNLLRSQMRLRYEGDALAEALHFKSREALQATQAKSQFLAAASHDLRQPLHALSLFIDALKGSDTELERKNIFPRIELSLDALRKLFDALLDVSRLDAGVVKPDICHFDIAELLKTLSEEFSPSANEKKLKLKVYSRKLVVKTDRLLLERILRNLISNAIRFTESGGILLSARIREDKISLQVWDTGIGIPQESKDDVFVEFHQLHNTHRDRMQGLGLGLAIVKRLCELLDHPLELISKQNKGTVFNILMPIGDAELMISADTSKITYSWDLTGRCIVVIDDERDILHAMDTLLSRWGCRVVIAESLQDAIDGLNKNKLTPDLILSDLRLKGDINGIEVINSLRNQFGLNIEGILITGETSPEQIKISKESSYKVLQKPVKPMILRSVINHYLSEEEN